MLSRIGFYCWAGPGTERILKTKYFNPKIDKKSLFSSYDYDYLKKVKDIFGITDAWISYSWGFSDENEKEDHRFTIERLKNFKKLGIKTHAYLQGCNLVYDNFKSEDFWCRDEKDNLVTYYKGRKVACVNNPNFRKFFRARLEELISHLFDGVYVDNIQMGQLGVPMPNNERPFVFTGCRCAFCQKKFKVKYNVEIPSDLEENIKITDQFLQFRIDSIDNFLYEISKLVRNSKKAFGTNSYDPKFNSRNVYGFDITKIQKYQDYLLFENHALKDDSIQNEYINKIATETNKPVFVVSYKKGIGFENQFLQKDFDLIYSEAEKSKFFPAIKGSEYKTNGVWHNLYLNKLKTPNTNVNFKENTKYNSNSLVTKLLRIKLVRQLTKAHYNKSYTLIMENKYMRPLMNLVYELVLH